MELAQKLLFSLFPSRCLLCRQTVGGQVANELIEICPDCLRALPYNTSCCVRCALPLAEEDAINILCGHCITKMPAYDYSHSLFRYEDDVIKLIHQLKFAEKITYARTIGEMLLARLQAEIQITKDAPECLLPVPLHKTRLRQRGFNQSIEIARVLAKKLEIPIVYDLVTRQRSTESQTGLNAKQRTKNIRGAFSVMAKINYKHVLIIDDVVTTGSTVSELARVLKQNRVKRVGVLSIARAPARH